MLDQGLPTRKPSQTEALILGNGGSLLGRPWASVPRDRVFIFGVNQSWREVPDADAHFANDADQYDFDNPTAAGFGGRAYYHRLARARELYHPGTHGEGILLHRHDELVFSRNPFRHRCHGANRSVKKSEDGGITLKIPPGGSAGSSAYVALQLVAAGPFERIWMVGFDMDALKFDGAKGYTGLGKKVPTDVQAWSNSVTHDKLWANVPADVLERVRVIAPCRSKVLPIVDAWPWEVTP